MKHWVLPKGDKTTRVWSSTRGKCEALSIIYYNSIFTFICCNSDLNLNFKQPWACLHSLALFSETYGCKLLLLTLALLSSASLSQLATGQVTHTYSFTISLKTLTMSTRKNCVHRPHLLGERGPCVVHVQRKNTETQKEREQKDGRRLFFVCFEGFAKVAFWQHC